MPKAKTKPLPSRARLRELLEYDEDTGILRWKYRPLSEFTGLRSYKTWNRRYEGAIAGTVRADSGCRVLKVEGESHYAHRLVWRWVTGEDAEIIHHLDSDFDNNRLANLKPGRLGESSLNKSRRRDNISKVPGVHQHIDGKWKAHIGGGRTRHLGTFRTKAEAVAKRRQAERELGYLKAAKPL